MQLNTQKQGAAAVSVDGVTIPGPWQSLEGDSVSASVEKVHPGHLESAIGLADPPEHEDIVVARTYDTDAVDDLYTWLKARAGLGAGVVTRMILNADKSVRSSDTNTGTLVSVSRSDYDSSSGSVTQLRLGFSIDGP